MKQELSDTPDTKAEKKAQKGAIPKRAIFIALGIVAVFLLYFLNVFV